MTGIGLARLLVRALTLIVLVVSAVYLIVYLYRWEWNRALISGVFLLVALITLSTSMLLRRLHRVEIRLEAARRAWSAEAAAQVQESNDAHAARHFEWLRRPPDRLSVFVPVLLGAGALLSGLAYVIERVAGVIAQRTIDRPLTAGMAGDLPLGPISTDVARPQLRGPRPQPRPMMLVLTVTVLAAAITVAVLVIREATQSRTETGYEVGAIQVDLEIEQKRRTVATEEAAEALWVACRERVPTSTKLIGIQENGSAGSGEIRMTLDEGMGPLRRRRFFGCMEDATIDLVGAKVVGYQLLAEDPPPPPDDDDEDDA